jgi:DNA replication protein DnaC
VIDEVGYLPFEPEPNLFFQLVSSRYERASLIVTSNKVFGQGVEIRAAVDSSTTRPGPGPALWACGAARRPVTRGRGA